MNHGIRHPRASRLRPALAALVVGLWMIGGVVPASPASPARVHGGHRCACGMDCGSVCCCKHKKAEGPAPERAKPPTRTNPTLLTGPCVAPAPCGAALPPGVSAVALTGDSADRAGAVAFLPASTSGLLVPPASDRASVRIGSPPDEPPERLADA